MSLSSRNLPFKMEFGNFALITLSVLSTIILESYEEI